MTPSTRRLIRKLGWMSVRERETAKIALRWAASKRARLPGTPDGTVRWFEDLDDAIKELEGRS